MPHSKKIERRRRRRKCSRQKKTSSSLHAANKLPLRLPLLRTIAQAAYAPQVAHHVLCLAKVDVLQQVAHLELHVLDEAADVCNVAVVVLDGQVLLDLAGHVAAEVHVADGALDVCGKREDDGRGELVVRCAAALDGFEDVDGVPDAFGVGAWGGGYLFIHLC